MLTNDDDGILVFLDDRRVTSPTPQGEDRKEEELSHIHVRRHDPQPDDWSDEDRRRRTKIATLTLLVVLIGTIIAIAVS